MTSSILPHRNRRSPAPGTLLLALALAGAQVPAWATKTPKAPGAGAGAGAGSAPEAPMNGRPGQAPATTASSPAGAEAVESKAAATTTTLPATGTAATPAPVGSTRERIADLADFILGRAAGDCDDAQVDYNKAFMVSARELGYRDLDAAIAGRVDAHPRVERALEAYFEALVDAALARLDGPRDEGLEEDVDAATMEAVREAVRVQAADDMHGLHEGLHIVSDQWETLLAKTPAVKGGRQIVRVKRTMGTAGPGAGAGAGAGGAASDVDDPMED